MPAPPHPGGGGGPGKGPPLHRCCHPCTAGTALGLRSGCRGPTRRGPQEPKTAASGLRSLVRTGEGGLGPGPMPWAPLPRRLEAGRPSKAHGRLWVRPRVEDGELDVVVSSAIKRSRKPSRSPLRYVCVCVCARARARIRAGREFPLPTSTSGWPPRPLRGPRFFSQASPSRAALPPRRQGALAGIPAGRRATCPGNALGAGVARHREAP